ncbi:MAG: HPr family phosphocarrier protein [Moraxellaceae bacterium]|jgi:phosphotransferase system HPr (HPr) family protein|nr:HPr family phosphocarrier protein [Moraxellaceae bacterium]
MIETEIEIINKLGLHARAAAKLVSVATQFQAKVQIGRGERLIDAKSIMALLMLGAGKGSVLRLRVEGSDAEAAHAAVTTLINNRFDEAE